jgi:cholesterol transport system auxiliary component
MKKLLILAILGIAGCAIPKAQTAVAIYDFGSQRLTESIPLPEDSLRTGHARLHASLLVPDIVTPVWLDSTAIQYRLAYDDLARVHAYAASRWASTPGSLLAQRIRNRIAAISDGAVVNIIEGARTDYTLRLELEEFTQVFDTEESSRVVVKFRASLIDRGTRIVMSQRGFSAEQAAPSANGPGAVHALTDASDKAIQNLIAWLVEELSEEKKNTPTRG